MLKIYYW